MRKDHTESVSSRRFAEVHKIREDTCLNTVCKMRVHVLGVAIPDKEDATNHRSDTSYTRKQLGDIEGDIPWDDLA